MPSKHMDEAKKDAIRTLQKFLTDHRDVERMVLIDDLFGQLRVVLWTKADNTDEIKDSLNHLLIEAASPFWTQEIWLAENVNPSDDLVYKHTWNEAHPVDIKTPRLRVDERRRNRSAWFGGFDTPPWSVDSPDCGPPIITFYSFKGGVGRTTALAAFAIQRARAGERVAVVDLDLDAPGAGVLLASDERGTTAPWGAIDYLLEESLLAPDMRDYYHACRRESVTRKGEIVVVPAGTLSPNTGYLNKLARIDFEPTIEGQVKHPIHRLVRQVRESLQPQWVLLDARAGLSEPAGLLLGGLAHLHVLFGTSSEQSWQGIRIILERMGASRVRENQHQLECLLVHAMVPEDIQVGMQAKAAFAARAMEEFQHHYYVQDPENPEEDDLWFMRDADNTDAPSVPVPISYQPKLAHYDCIDDVADTLADSPEYQAMTERITQRFLSRE